MRFSRSSFFRTLSTFFFLVLSSFVVAAMQPVTFTTQPANPLTIFQTHSTDLNYTVRNNTKVTLPILSITTSFAGVTRDNTVAQNCGTQLAPHATCNLLFHFTASGNTGSFQNLLSINYGGRYPLIDNLNLVISGPFWAFTNTGMVGGSSRGLSKFACQSIGRL